MSDFDPFNGRKRIGDGLMLLIAIPVGLFLLIKNIVLYIWRKIKK